MVERCCRCCCCCCEPISDMLRFYNIDCYAIQTSTTKNRLSEIKLSVLHDQTSVESLSVKRITYVDRSVCKHINMIFNSLTDVFINVNHEQAAPVVDDSGLSLVLIPYRMSWLNKEYVVCIKFLICLHS